jgi:transcription termination factor Rho
MKCQRCTSELRKVLVSVEGAKQKAISFQCPKCDYFEFEPISSKKVVEELKNTPLQIRQKVVKLSEGRLGIYFSKDIIRSINLKQGEEVYISIPDKKHLVMERKTVYGRK